MAEIKVTFSGLPDLLTAIESMKTRIDAATGRATSQGGQSIVNEAKANFIGSHPVGFPHVGGPTPNVVTGNLKRSIRTQTLQPLGQGKYRITAGPTAIYGRIIELGGTITPKDAHMLSWIGASGRRVFAKKVVIPPYPYFRPGYLTALSKMNEIFTSAWRKALTSG